MRQIREPVLAFTFNSTDKHLPKTVRKCRQKYKRVSDILDAQCVRLVCRWEIRYKDGPGGRVTYFHFDSPSLLRGAGHGRSAKQRG